MVDRLVYIQYELKIVSTMAYSKPTLNFIGICTYKIKGNALFISF